jgi:FKBP-type peptidyl-prolyl cis-trans isomerase (trigger factor)
VGGASTSEEEIDVTIEIELMMQATVSEHEVAAVVLDALEADERVTVDFTCLTTHDSRRE